MRFACFLVLMLIHLCGVGAHADGLWGPQGFRSYGNGLPVASEESLKKVTKAYWETLRSRSDLDLKRVRVARFEDIDPVLDRASQAGLGTLDLFTQKELADPASAALLLDGPTLRRIGQKYDLSSLWMISARTLLPDHRTLSMDYMIVGQGKLIIGYPYESKVEVINDGKPYEYRYEPYLEARVVNGPGKQGLFNIRVLTSPAGEFQSFQGPMGASINALQVDNDTVVVNYTLGFDQDARTRRTPITLKRAEIAQSSGISDSKL